ncbi:MAG TPA: hypothetical protein VNF73_01275, partial [Candidatus Saccharimonadales bacterium]|nr:hypothetical protein [Candidatus Saccharimonadales bacterium]
MNKVRSGSIDTEDLRSAVDAQDEPSGPVRSCKQLTVDVPEVRSAHDGQVDRSGGEFLDKSSQTIRDGA